MISRRTVLQGLAASVALPVVAKAAIAKSIRVWASNQSGNALTVEPLPHALNLGDVFTIDGVFAWHRVDNTPTRHLRQFVIVKRAGPEHRVVHLYPPIIGEHDPRYRTIVDYPMNRAVVRVVLPRQHSAA